MVKRGIPKKDGSGRGKGNIGRGGCKNPKGDRKGRKMSTFIGTNYSAKKFIKVQEYGITNNLLNE